MEKQLFNRQVTTLGLLEELQNDYSSWNRINEELIKRAFNKMDNEYSYEYESCTNGIGLMDAFSNHINTSSGEYKIKHQKDKIDACVHTLQNLVNMLPYIDQDPNLKGPNIETKVHTNKCFIVHGHNEISKLEVARYVENELKKKAIILHEQPNKGKTIMEKFEAHSDTDFAIALWTADDKGKAKADDNLNDRARQNVIFETGFFIGKLGRQNVIVLYESGVEIPSDYSGVIFIKLINNWKDDLRKEVEAIYNE
jgi:predicted nucleotide-binding protein